MAKSDVVVNTYLKDPRHFCDFFNGTFFDGEEVLCPENMYEKSGELKQSIPNKPGKFYVEKHRDAVIKADFHGIYSIFAIESQEKIHYAMPVRVMLYEALEYSQQIAKMKKQHRKDKDLKEAEEFLSGMRKSDYLAPIFTVVFYYGEKAWDGSKNLKEMFLLPEELQKYEKYLPEYPIHVICPEDIDPGNFKTELKEIFELLKRRKDGQELLRYAKEQEEKLQNWSVETKELAMTLMNGRQLWDKMEDKEGMDMCEAFRQLMEMGREEGREEGIHVLVDVLRNLGMSRKDVTELVMQQFAIDAGQTELYMGKYWG